MFALNEKLAADGKRAILWDYNNTYFTWPLLSAKGGYVFEQRDGGYDVSNTGVNNAGAKAGAKVLRELIDKGVMPKGADYSVAEAAFNKGDSAMMISGPWAWANIEKSGIDFGVAPIPAVDGEPGKPSSVLPRPCSTRRARTRTWPWSFSRTTCSRSRG